MKSFGLNYGVMFTAWGVGGLILPRIAGMAKDITGKEDLAFYIASGLMVCGALLALINLAMTRGKLEKIKGMHSKKDKTILSGHHVAGP
jgi:OFA family oxalate/formate antiporter-like MFS transporter